MESTIKEAYCSSEVSKLLREKGFNICVRSFYRDGILKHNTCALAYHAMPNNIISAPTHQMAMAWLREIHKLHIEIFVTWKNKIPHYQWRIENLLTQDTIFDTPCLTSCEEAVEAALKYVLENLVKI